MIDKDNLQPLVSIIVVTYNSSEYVLETLESAMAQTYQNIELIVSDDCSTDNTVEICREWIEENKGRFVRTELMTVEKNTGIAPNCNRGIIAAKGEWVKLIAGDDILLDECISTGVTFIKTHIGTKIFASNVKKFVSNHKIDTFEYTHLENDLFFLESNTAQNQFKIILQKSPIYAPSVFISKYLLILNNGFDESIPFMEDYPFWIKTLQNGIKIDFLPEITVGYRFYENSITGNNKQKIFNSFYKQYYIFQKEYTFKFLNFRQRFNQRYIYFVKFIFDYFNINDKRFSAFYLFCLRLNVFNWSKRTFNRLRALLKNN